ncbi:MAG: ankyrin repeat protein [Paenibacillaceae bacterium]|jgi:hypothetical protein|nr:ankyrin repeat protein [Paenibacillaceae bacterium]
MEEIKSMEPELVKQFVNQAHGNMDKVAEMLEQEPGLLNAAWDWGGGDWETALGAAAHCGRIDIVRYLLDRGARIDLFTAAMLGKLDVVKALIAAWPELRNAKGPHGIPLLVHAKAGGEEAQPVVDFLQQG